MVLRKITIDNSVRYIPIIEKTKGKEMKPKTIKVGSIPRKKYKKSSQHSKNFLENLAARGFGYITK